MTIYKNTEIEIKFEKFIYCFILYFSINKLLLVLVSLLSNDSKVLSSKVCIYEMLGLIQQLF